MAAAFVFNLFIQWEEMEDGERDCQGRAAS